MHWKPKINIQIVEEAISSITVIVTLPPSHKSSSSDSLIQGLRLSHLNILSTRSQNDFFLLYLTPCNPYFLACESYVKNLFIHVIPIFYRKNGLTDDDPFLALFGLKIFLK